MQTLRVWPGDKKDVYGYQRFLRLEIPGDVKVLAGRNIVFRISAGSCGSLDLLDSQLPLLTMLCMAEGCDLHVHGRVSRQVLRNMVEFQRAWLKWRPDILRHFINISADEVTLTQRRRTERAIQTFSGGLDAVFTTWFHKIGGEPIARLPLEQAVFVHGFDIARHKVEEFDRAFKKGQDILDTVGVELSSVRTNLRGAINIDWEVLHGAAIAAVLGQYSHDFTHGLIGSGGPYNDLGLPWGSNPITDPLMSGSDMQFVHVGCGYGRSEKAHAIHGWTAATDNLRVCWRSHDSSKNCGVCEKCIATALAFRAWGHPIPRSLKPEITEDDIFRCKVENENQKRRLLNLRSIAIENNVLEPWVTAIERKFRD